jgi:hypothetical protein
VGNDLLLAIDPGPEQSAWALYNVLSLRPFDWAKIPNHQLLSLLDDTRAETMAIEMVASYGMAVGRDVFETCVWAGRFIERWRVGAPHRLRHTEVRRIYRRDVKLHLCNSMKAKDTNIRQALIDRYGGKDKAVGLKATPGPLYGLTKDCWSALGVAITASETEAL